MSPDEFRENDELRNKLKALLHDPVFIEAEVTLRLRYGVATTSVTPALSEHDRAHAFSYLAGYNKAFLHLSSLTEAPKPRATDPVPFEHLGKSVPVKYYE